MEKKASNYLDNFDIVLPKGKINVSEDFILESLKSEYLYLQNAIDRYDGKALNIKSWSISFSIVIFGAAIIQDIPDLFLLACFSTVCFWVTETYWKIFQSSLYQRTHDIELFLNGKKMTRFRLINVVGSQQYEFKKVLSNSWYKIMWRPQVYLPHLIIALGSMIVWLAKTI